MKTVKIPIDPKIWDILHCEQDCMKETMKKLVDKIDRSIVRNDSHKRIFYNAWITSA